MSEEYPEYPEVTTGSIVARQIREEMNRRRASELAAPNGSALCELVMYSKQKKGAIRGSGIPLCGLPAFYRWSPRSRPSTVMLLCKEHGEGMAGNFTDELKVLDTRQIPDEDGAL